MKSKKKSLLLISVLSLALIVCVSIGMVLGIFKVDVDAQDGSIPTLIGGEIKEEYILGDFIEIPAAQLSYGGETKAAEIFVIQPDGARVRSSKVKLTEGGQYKAEFKATFGGKAKTVEKPFIVHIPLFSKNLPKTSWAYKVDDTAYQTGKEGVKVRLAKGDTLTFNDVVDLKKSNGQIIDFFLMPQNGVGTKDLKRVTLTITDLYDPSVQLTVILQCANDHGGTDKWWFDWTYVLVGGQNQTPTGVEGKGTDNEKKWVGGDWGSVVPYSFYGTRSNTSATMVGSESLNISYNESENAVYVGATQLISLSDLRYFEEPWTGFTNGEVKVSLSGDGFSLGTADLMITRIGVNNIRGEYFVDDTAPAITVDFAGYEENNLPTAGKGLSYPVFSATALDKVFGDVDVKTTVYYNYESQQRYQVDIKDSRFATDATGYYTIEYLAYDGFKNESKKLVSVYCGETTPAISVEAVGDYVTAGGTGALIMPAAIKYEGGTGIVKTYATAQSHSGGGEFVIDEGFRPEKEGAYTIRLYAVDVLGKTATFEYNLTISINDKPVFLDTPILPKFFLEGYKYTLPTIPAYDYSSGTQRQQIATTIAVKDGKNGGQVRDLTSNEADFEADADGYATIIYKATGAKGSGTVEYKVKVVDAWRDINSYTLDMKKYFYGENIEVTDSADSINVSASTDTSYIFVNPVIAHRFETKFYVANGGFSCLQLVFEDSKDPSIKFTVEIDKSSVETESAPLRVNGTSVKYCPWASFTNGTIFHLVYDETNKTIQVDGAFKNPVVNADGSAFEGFPSGLIYVTANVIGVEDGAEVAWKNFGGQILSSALYDTIVPSIKLSADYNSKYSINTVAEIYSAVAADVLSPEVYTSMTVRDPNGQVVTDINGLRLENVPFDQSYFINLNMYGSYSVKYTAMDWMEREQSYPFAILVVDDQKPAITLTENMPTRVEQGKTITVSNATANDNVDGAVSVYVYLVNPGGIISNVNFGEEVKLTEKGVYQLRYMSVDKFGNLNILYYEITVV